MSRQAARCPTEVRVIGKVYAVEMVDSIPDKKYGECDHDKLRIGIEKGTALGTEQDTVLHEVCHAVDFAMNTRISENQIRAFSTGLLAMLKENPKFVLYLVSP